MQGSLLPPTREPWKDWGFEILSSTWVHKISPFQVFFFLAVLGLNCSMQVLLIAERGLGYTGSAVAVLGFPLVLHGLSCPAACGILVPRPWIEPTSPALEAGFLTTGPPGKFPIPSLNISFLLNGFTLTRKTALSCKAVNSVKFCILLSMRLALWL